MEAYLLDLAHDKNLTDDQIAEKMAERFPDLPKSDQWTGYKVRRRLKSFGGDHDSLMGYPDPMLQFEEHFGARWE
jgi:hypothetical protein